MLLITYSREILDGEPIYVCSNSLPAKALSLEPAGHAFHAAALRLTGHIEEVQTEKDDKEVSEDKESVYVQSSDAYSNKGRKKSGSESKQQDHYALLGLSHLRYLATEDQIRKSYREAALRHHPDKQAALLLAEETEATKQAKKDEIESFFKAIQEAYEVLIDPVRRRIYDSTDEFDDKIPYDCASHEFFKVFGPAFLRNGRWSINQPVPTLGDDKTPFKEVDSFYDFWYSFKSWREFPHADEFELDQAESREHRRWMERQNTKLSEGARKEEYIRIRTLVDNAYKRDPRLLRRKEEQKAEKLRKKEAKLLAKRLQEEEEARIVEVEKQRKEEEEKKAAEAASNQKKMKEREKKLLRKERTRLRSLAAPILSQHPDLTDGDVEDLCSSFDKEQLRNLCDMMEGKELLESAKLLLKVLKVDHKDKDEKQANKNLQQNGSVGINGQPAQSSNEKREKPWQKEEIELLRKGVQKYPKGTSRRWEVISEYIGTKRSVEEILKATKTVLLQKPDSANAFDSFLEKRKSVQTISSPLTTREDLPVLSNGNVSEGNASSVDILPESPIQAGSTAAIQAGSTAADGVTPSVDQDSWSAAQERALVQALKTFPKEITQRWERVSTAVPGKNMSQCKKKFALMKESFRNNKSTNKQATHSDDSPNPSNHIGNSVVSDDSNVANGISPGSDEDTRSEVQEKALTQALKTFPKDTNQRWERVAGAVPGKSVDLCKKKLASSKDNLRNKKSAV